MLSKSRKSHQSSNKSKKYIKFQFDEKTVKVPRVLDDRFVLQDILDRGGFGSIINAYDTKNENGKVATTPAIVKIVSWQFYQVYAFRLLQIQSRNSKVGQVFNPKSLQS